MKNPFRTRYAVLKNKNGWYSPAERPWWWLFYLQYSTYPTPEEAEARLRSDAEKRKNEQPVQFIRSVEL